jgi:kynurenine--oxoglutarate transaminase/cysteine-S-conjugate beta-lyase/glutamine--phenylpyruvate transaminase
MFLFQLFNFKATFPGMWERTVTIGSAGKVFGSTGCKIGITIGPQELIKKNSMVQYNSIYCCPTFFQEVIARCFEVEFSRLDQPDCYINSLPRMLRDKRDRFAKMLIEAGLEPVLPEGGYFMLANISKITEKVNTGGKADECKDLKFVKYLIKEKGLATIPISIFYSANNAAFGENFIRFNFFKDEETLAKATEILKSLSN